MSEAKQRPKPVLYNDLFPSRFLTGKLLAGKSPTVTITDVETEEFQNDKGRTETRGVLSFKETGMQFKLNSTNGQCVKAMFGVAIRDWIGKRLTLCTEKDRDPGGHGMVDAVRVAGSPDIDRDITVSIELPKRKPRPRKLTKTMPRGATHQEQQPGPEPAEPREPAEEHQ